MDNPIMFLHAVKETYALSCLFALLLAGPAPVTQKRLREMTGVLDDEAMSASLRKLEVFGLVICSGARHKTAWQLTPAARQLPLGFSLEAPAPDSGPDRSRDLPGPVFLPAPTPVKPESDLPGAAISMGTPVKPESEIPESSVFNLNNNDSGILQNGDSVLKAQLYRALAEANVYHQLRQALVDHFLADGPERWVKSLLGWICFAVREGASANNKKSLGQRVYPVITLSGGHRPEHAPADCLPPAGMAFDTALAWALAGGPDPEPPEPEPAPAKEPVSASIAPGAAFWEQVRAALQLELSRTVFETWVRPLAFGSFTPALDGQGDVLLLVAPSVYMQDFVSVRLLGTLQAASVRMARHAVTVRVTREA